MKSKLPKVALSSRQEYNYLKHADEINFQFRDRKAIPDFIERYPNAAIILKHSFNDEEIDWNEMRQYNVLARGNFILCVNHLEYGKEAKKNDIKFYYGYPISSFYQLRALKEMGVCYVRLDAPLFFKLRQVKNIGVPIRAIPNVCYVDGLDRENGITGTWIRPEDLKAYGKYIDAIEFEDCNLSKERALYRIYYEDGYWEDNLNLIFTNMNVKGKNHLINSSYSRARMNCGHRCAETGACHICHRLIDLADEDRLLKYLKS